MGEVALAESAEADDELPEVSAGGVLKAFDAELWASVDEEAVEYLVASGVGKLWKVVYRDETRADEVAAEAESFHGEHYGQQVRDQFLAEYRAAKELPVPEGYNFRPNGRDLADPNLMQRHAASLVRDKRRVGNWSGTGAGKTLSAILASRVISPSLTVVCCPNSVVDGWSRDIQGAYPDSEVVTKTWNPRWSGNSHHRYLVLNYEMFQLERSPGNISRYLRNETPGFIVIDEIHFAKQASPNAMSRRREMVMALVANATEANPELHVLGMSATPVINNLYEGRSMVEMVTSQEFPDLEVFPSVNNAMRVHQQLVRLGVRWMPDYAPRLIEERPEVDCSEYIDEIRTLGKAAILSLEQILTRARLPEIRRRIKPKTLIYTMLIKGIDRILHEALTEDGWKVGFYTGDDKSGLEGFLEGDVDVLIGTSAIGTGIDRLQLVCDQLIVNVMPWTAAEYEQLKGRIYRQGQTSDKVTVIIPTTYADVGGERWSWCESKWQRVKFKKSLADAAVDGVVPEGHLRSPAQAYSDAMKWLERLDTEGTYEISRPSLVIPLADAEDEDHGRRIASYGNFSRMNQRWNAATGATTHGRLRENPDEWRHYHSLYREARKDWAVVPFEEMAKDLLVREGYVVGDFGCGEAVLAEKLGGHCTVHSFDHVAVNDSVSACDMADVPIDDGELDVAVFCLSLMGSNFTDYLKEAHRTLKLDGRLHIYEATSGFTDRDQFAADLKTLGFGQVSIEDEWKFTHIIASKDRLNPRRPVEKLGGL